MHVNNRIDLAWASLLALTLGSFIVGIQQSADFTRAGAALVIGIALIKARMIGTYFMDLRLAPRSIQSAFDAYLLVLLAVLVTIDMAN
jgi:hypothetical protein